jgi:osmotically-inducible protein OsmY
MVTADRVRDHIIRHLKWDHSLKGSQINVDYLGRTAILTGTVPNLVAHETAQRDAQSIPGVDLVENRLTVKLTHNHPNKPDETVQQDIKTILSCTADIDMRHITVTVVDGIVNLKGTIDAYWKKSRIEDLAASIDGVLKVNNEVRVLAVDKAPDILVKKDILSALERMEVKGLENLKVDVSEGIVTIKGTVPTWSIAFDVEDTARYTAGVIDVKNDLAVE